MQNELLKKHKTNNIVHSILLISGMILLLSLLGWSIGGTVGLMLLAMIGGTLLLLSPHAPPQLILRMYNARPLAAYEAPELRRVVSELSDRADLPCEPALYYIPSRWVNAISVGRCGDAAIGVTDELLRHLNRDELVGVLAHEISHIRHNDVWVMGLASMISRATSTLSWVGQILFFINLPLILLGSYSIPWLFILLLIVVPTLVNLLQFALFGIERGMLPVAFGY